MRLFKIFSSERLRAAFSDPFFDNALVEQSTNFEAVEKGAMLRRQPKFNYQDVRDLSFETLIRKGLVSKRLIAEFKDLESQMVQGGMMGDDFLVSYQKSDDIYKRQLTKVLEALRDIGEPHAGEKLRVVTEELATMGPAGFLTPWEITLSYLDREYGDFADVGNFYQRSTS
jgi:hypothetical protein